MKRGQLLAGLLVASTAMAWADWEIDNSSSKINFVSVKNDSIGEMHSFDSLEGYINVAGNAQLTVNLESVETLIEVRNERMRELLFETVQFPVATISAFSSREFELLPFDDFFQYRFVEAACAVQYVLVEHLDAARGNRTHCQFRLERRTEFADDECVEFCVERLCDFEGDRNTSSRQSQYQWVIQPKSLDFRNQRPTRIAAVIEDSEHGLTGARSSIGKASVACLPVRILRHKLRGSIRGFT